MSSDRALAWLRILTETWATADVSEAKADLLHAIYERIVVVGRRFVAARLTPAAYANGLALALPQVVWRARRDLNPRPPDPKFRQPSTTMAPLIGEPSCSVRL